MSLSAAQPTGEPGHQLGLDGYKRALPTQQARNVFGLLSAVQHQYILAEGAIALSVTLSGGALFAS